MELTGSRGSDLDRHRIEARHGRDPFIAEALLRIQRAEIRVWAKNIAEGKGRKRPAPYLANRAIDY